MWKKSVKTAQEQEVKIPVDKVVLSGNLTIPPNAEAIVVFAHGSGSSRFSPRNKYVADVLQEAGLATLLFDLLTKSEDEIDSQTGELRFNIRLLADRMKDVSSWLVTNKEAKDLKIMYFGASTGAAAALVAAAEQRESICAIVSRGGRPDLAGECLLKVKAPTLLIVGGDDSVVIDMNRKALEALSCEKMLTIIPGATHLFEEPGTLEEVARIAKDWFLRHLRAGHATKA